MLAQPNFFSCKPELGRTTIYVWALQAATLGYPKNSLKLDSSVPSVHSFRYSH